MGQGSARIFNIVSILFLVLTLLVVFYVVIQLVASPASVDSVDFEPTLALPAEEVAPPADATGGGEVDAEPTLDPTATGE